MKICNGIVIGAAVGLLTFAYLQRIKAMELNNIVKYRVGIVAGLRHMPFEVWLEKYHVKTIDKGTYDE